jgi:uroporphyrinogen III methyltransferase/synthase
LSGLTICCIGPRTAEALAAYGVRADVIPEQFQAEGILDALAARQIRGAKVLIPRALVARELLPEQLRAQGAEVDVVPVYRTILPTVALDRLVAQLGAGEIDVISFTSSSTVRNFVGLFPSKDELLRLIGETTVACIGPITAATVREASLTVHVMAAENTIPSLAEAIVRHIESPPDRRPASAANR